MSRGAGCGRIAVSCPLESGSSLEGLVAEIGAISALAEPGLREQVAEKVRDRVEILQAQRKRQEEEKIRKPMGKDKGMCMGKEKDQVFQQSEEWQKRQNDGGE